MVPKKSKYLIKLDNTSTMFLGWQESPMLCSFLTNNLRELNIDERGVTDEVDMPTSCGGWIANSKHLIGGKSWGGGE